MFSFFQSILIPRWPQDGLDMVATGPKMNPGGPKMAQDGPKIGGIFLGYPGVGDRGGPLGNQFSSNWDQFLSI